MPEVTVARCGCANSQCNCVVQAGDRVTVTGNGSPDSPYTISADGGVTTVADTPSVDMTIAGSGTTADPYVLSAAVRYAVDPDNCARPGSDGGVYVPCADANGGTVVQDDGSTTTVTGTGTPTDPYVVTAHPVSADPGNVLVTGSDGRAYISCDQVAGCVSVVDADTADIDMTVSGAGTPTDPYVVSAVLLRRELAHTKLAMSTTQTVPATAGACQTMLFDVGFDTTQAQQGDTVGGGGGITIGHDGRYTLTASMRDNQLVNGQPGLVNDGDQLYAFATQILVNGTEVAQERVTRYSRQTHVLNPSVTLDLRAGDVVSQRVTFHSTGGPSVPHALIGDVNNKWLEVVELPTTVPAAT